MLFNYKVITPEGEEQKGTIDASSEESAVAVLEGKGLVVASVESIEKKSLFSMDLTIFERVSNKDVVILSRQIATLFESHVSALRVFRLLSQSVENPLLSRTLIEISDDIEGGATMSQAMKKHPKVFSDFYVNMVYSGEDSGNLSQTFGYLADYLDRTYALVSKTRNALIYPAFVIVIFVTVMVLMLTLVIPKLSDIIKSAGQEPPIYTKIVIGTSEFLVNYGFLILLFLIALAVFFWQFGSRFNISWDRIKISIPYIGGLFRKFYLSRVADNFYTMISSGIPMVRTIEVTATIIGNEIYEEIMNDVAEQVRGGSSVSSALSEHDEIPNIMVQMTKVGEETGEFGNILKTLADFYRREVHNAVDTLIDLIEPAMIVALGVAVGGLLASVLMPIYSLGTSI